MKMTVHAAPQGSAQWVADRAERYNAGDAAAMLGCDTNGRTRTDLLDEMVTGLTPEVSAFKQRLYDKGHAVEAMTRPLAEGMVGEELYTLVGSIEVPGLSRRVGASFDGLTMPRDTNFECKSLNEALIAALPAEDDPDANDAAQLPKGYRVQMEQQLMVSSAERVLFCAAAFHDDGSTKSLRACWYRSDAALRQEILAGWQQLEADLATHVPKVHQERPVGEKQEALPALFVQVEGRIVSSNLQVWREAALAHIAGINKDLKTDDDFATAKEAVKWCKDSADKLKLLKDQTLAQMVDVNELVTTMDRIVAGLDRTRIDLDGLVAQRETAIRQEVAARGAVALNAHIEALNERIGEDLMPAAHHPLIAADFQKAIKSKRTIKSLNDSVDAELARCKIAASGLADRITKNRKHLADHCADYMALFADMRNLCLKECDDFKAIASSRISEVKAAEEKRLEAEREKIRAQEQAKAEKDARDKLAAEQREAEAKRRVDERLASAAAMNNIAEARKADALPGPVLDALETAASGLIADLVIGRAASPPTVVPIRPAVDTRPPIRLGQICERLGFTVTADFLKQLGFEPVATEKSAKLYRASDFDLICEALCAHVRTVQHQQAKAA